MSLIGKRFSILKNDLSYSWLVVDEDDVFLYARYLPDKSGKIYRQIKSVLVKYPFYYMPDLQLTLF